MKIFAVYNNFHTCIFRNIEIYRVFSFENNNKTNILIENGQVGEYMFHWRGNKHDILCIILTKFQ